MNPYRDEVTDGINGGFTMSGTEKSAGIRGRDGRWCHPQTARERMSVPPLEERFFDLHLPLDSDWLEDMERGTLFEPPSISRKARPMRMDVNRRLIEEAVALARERGLPPERIPRFRVIRGVVHACSDNGRVLRLEHSLFWEIETGYDALLGELLEQPPVDQYSIQAGGKAAGQ